MISSLVSSPDCWHIIVQETAPPGDNEPEMLGARRTFKVKRKRMKNKLKFKKASLNATDLMKGEDGTFMLLKKKCC